MSTAINHEFELTTYVQGRVRDAFLREIRKSPRYLELSDEGKTQRDIISELISLGFDHPTWAIPHVRSQIDEMRRVMDQQAALITTLEKQAVLVTEAGFGSAQTAPAVERMDVWTIHGVSVRYEEGGRVFVDFELGSDTGEMLRDAVLSTPGGSTRTTIIRKALGVHPTAVLHEVADELVGRRVRIVRREKNGILSTKYFPA